MDSFNLEPTTRTPRVQLDPITGECHFTGRSIPDNSVEFYKPIFDWISNFLASAPKRIAIVIRYDYYNTSTAKCLVDIFRKLQEAHQSGIVAVNVTWEYEPGDEEMQESGEEYKASVQFPFTTKEK